MTRQAQPQPEGSPSSGGRFRLPAVSIVVPVLDEEARLPGLLDHLRDSFPDCELVIADGGSTDRTVSLARERARVVQSAPGRARQMNAGAAVAAGEVLWFVHADTHVPAEALGQLRAALSDERVVGGGLRLRFDRRSLPLDWVVWTSNLRARYLHWIFGDQALFVRRGVFADVGGFPELPIMEDLEMSLRLNRRGRLMVLAAASTASVRRFTERGTLRMLALMQWLKLAYFLGVDPERINRRYLAERGRRAEPAPGAGKKRDRRGGYSRVGEGSAGGRSSED